MDQQNPEYLTNKQDFANFLEPEHGETPYTEKVQTMLEDNKKRLIVDLNHINQYDTNLRTNLLKRPMDYIPAWEDALREYVDARPETEKEQLGQTYKVGLEGNFGGQRLTPQRLMSGAIGSMVCVEGIVTKVSLVRPKVMETVHYCEATKQFKTQNYRDATSLTGLPTGANYPTTDDQGNPLTTEFGLCTYMDHQTVFIQDMPERTQAGSMPQTVECIIDDDLVDHCKPGDRVQMIGIFRALAGRAAGSTSGRFKTVIIVNNVHKLGIDDQSRTLSVGEIKNIKKMAKSRNIFSMLARSIAPSLFGHNFIKKAILLQLLGGMEKNLDNGTHIRGDINILMVGDPSCGKSQLLRAVMNIAPLAINTTGRGSSGVGLTAAVTMDKDSGERRLEAGAMVLADRGIVCIDEFDKMSDTDRTAIHEVMEQQTVTIAKAGIHTSLNARCSVIAAANPVYGMYDRTRKPYQNIGLPDSLLSRFDLLFIVLDKIDTQIDRSISEHVLAMHLTPHREIDDSMFDDLMIEEDEGKDVEIFEQKVPHLRRSGNRRRNQRGRRGRRGGNNDNSNNNNNSNESEEEEDMRYLTIPFCKKYIEFAKKQYKPKLEDDACELIAKKYAELREAEYDHTLPITARCLETIIRLSTAHAKIRLSRKVTEEDVEEAMTVLQFALTNDAEPQDRESERRQRREGTEDAFDQSGDESDGNGGDDENGGGSDRRRRGQRRGAGRGGAGRDRRSDKREIDEESNDSDGDIDVRTTQQQQRRGKRGQRGGGRRRRGSQTLEESDDNGTETENENEDEDAKMDYLDEMPGAAAHGQSKRRNKNKNKKTRKTKTTKKRSSPVTAIDENENEENIDTPQRRSKRLKTTFSNANVNKVVTTITNVFRTKRLSELSLTQLQEELDSRNEGISASELKAIVLHLHSQNRLFYLETSEMIHQL